MTTLPDGLVLRKRRSSDDPYLATTFLHSAHNLAMFQGTPERLYKRQMSGLFSTFVNHKLATTAIICEREDPDWIVAWLTAWIMRETSVIWYSYTRAKHRRQGLCELLVTSLPGKAKASVFTSRAFHRINQKHDIIRYPTLILEVSNDSFNA